MMLPTDGGSLDGWRAKASFNPKQLQETIEGKESCEYRDHLVEVLSREPVFRRNYIVPSCEQRRAANHARWQRLVELNLVPDDGPYTDVARFQDFLWVLEAYDQGLSARYSLSMNVFYSALMSMGTDKHMELMEKCARNELVGCFCLTELSHGSNTAGMQTRVRWVGGKWRFQTPTAGAVKCWAGNLSSSATHAVVFALLEDVDGRSHGLHAFAIPIRDPLTWKTLPGIEIGDMGVKPGGWNGVENGWMRFNGHLAHLDALLDKGCQITADGHYKSIYKTTSERQSVSLGALSVGRIGIVGKGVAACQFASTIAIRYSCVRRQFGPPTKDELTVWSYPLQRHRLLPYLGAAFVLRLFHKRLYDHFADYMMQVMTGEKSDTLAALSKEVHGLSSVAKPVSTWIGNEALTEARRACGGHGFLHLSRLNELKDDADPSQTFEGENNILLQQTSNWLLGLQTFKSPLETVNFLQNREPAFSKFSSNTLQDVLAAYRWLARHLLDQTAAAVKSELAAGRDEWTARNNTQVHTAHNLSRVYGEHTILKWFSDAVDALTCARQREILTNLGVVFAVQRLETHLADLYIGGYTTGAQFGQGLRERQAAAENALANEAAALVDAIAPHDFLLNSALGASDGRAYEHIMAEFESRKDFIPSWTSDLSQFLQNRQKHFQSKL